MEIISREEARKLGLRRYFTGVVCAHGHVCERQTSNKTCMACARSKKLSETTKKKNSERGRNWYLARRDAELLRRRENYRTKSDYYKKLNAEYRASRKHEQAARRRRHYEQNAHRYKSQAVARRDFIMRATPAWADVEAINSFYLRAAQVTKATGIKYHVDHVIPLRGKTVCGLHVETNLQVLPAVVNLAKHNHLLQCA